MLVPLLAAALAAAPAVPPPVVTPVVMRVAHAPVPVLGGDGRWHAVYELELVNFAPKRVTIRSAEALDGGRPVLALAGSEVAARLATLERSSAAPVLGPRELALLYLHASFARAEEIPARLAHRLRVQVEGGASPIVETGGGTPVAAASTLLLDPPLRGARFLAADGCCDSVRHVRATLPLDGALHLGQRFAIDFERVDAEGRIAAGDVAKPASYAIYGEPVYAVADARVAVAVDGLPDSPPGKLPAGLTPEQSDGNHVILDLGGGRWALFAHLAPGSVRVRSGDAVKRGDVLGNVGTSGNSSEPHLHFQVMDAPSALVANGLPYAFRAYRAARKGTTTAAFDHAAASGDPLPLEAVAGPPDRTSSLPLDLWVVDFP